MRAWLTMRRTGVARTELVAGLARGFGFGLDGPAEAEVEGTSTETCALFARFACGGAVAEC